MKPVYLLLLIIFAFTSCTHKAVYSVAPVLMAPFTTYKNVVYGNDSNEQDLDVYLPPVRDTSHTPVIILIHGGAWVQGDKADFTGFGLDTFFTANGCAVVNMNYRLIDSAYRYPDPLDDVGLVMAFIQKKSVEWQINPNRVCMVGRSSGSQLALMYAYSRNQNGKVKAVIDGFGPTDFCDSSVIAGPLGLNVINMLGQYGTDSIAWHNASPIFYLAGSVPTVIMQGTDDNLVYPIQSEMLEDSLLIRGVPCQYYPWVGDGHGWDLIKWNECRGAIMTWLKAYL